MKEEILKLRNEGKTYKQIQGILKCSKSLISYYCGDGQKEKINIRRIKYRKDNPMLQKIDKFKNRNQKENDSSNEVGDREKRYFVNNVRFFQKGRIKKGSNFVINFNWEDIISLYGEDTYCYLSGEPINLFKNNYHFDHITPKSKGGDNTLNNLGITHKVVNQMKSDLTVDELLEWCVKILKHNGYSVTK